MRITSLLLFVILLIFGTGFTPSSVSDLSEEPEETKQVSVIDLFETPSPALSVSSNESFSACGGSSSNREASSASGSGCGICVTQDTVDWYPDDSTQIVLPGPRLCLGC